MTHTVSCILIGVGVVLVLFAFCGAMMSLHHIVVGDGLEHDGSRWIGLRNLVGFLLLALPLVMGCHLHSKEEQRLRGITAALKPAVERAEYAACEKAGYATPHWRVEVIVTQSGKSTSRRAYWTFHCTDLNGALHEVIEPACNQRRFAAEAAHACEDQDVAALFESCHVALARQ